MFNMSKMHGGLIEDRGEHQLYAANNQYVDIPFVFNGPIDPWLSFQDGQIFGGDARNTTFRRMMLDARQSGRQITDLATQSIDSLRYALDVQVAVANGAIATGPLTIFAQPDSLLELSGNQIYELEEQLNLQELPLFSRQHWMACIETQTTLTMDITVAKRPTRHPRWMLCAGWMLA